MISRKNPRTNRVLQWLTISLGTSSLALVVYAFAVPTSGQLEGRLLPHHLREEQQWVTVTEDLIRKGYSIPAHTNVILHIPEEISRITRRTLFGRRGTRIRYWGYCFPENYEQAQELKRKGFPGTLFLSEKEREDRAAFAQKNREESFSVSKNLNDRDLNRKQEVRSTIRHQMEIFTGGQSCYIMTEEPIPIGTDNDSDGANIAVENDFTSDPDNSDTDGDGIRDGLEIFRLHTMPTKRDTDGDGLIDGIEDTNRNGRIEEGETDPTEWDSDHDGLCDGLCLVNKGTELRGEDKNLNGVWDEDENESDPLKKDTDGDGISDEQEYFNCILANGNNC